MRHPVAEALARALTLAPGIVPLAMVFGAAAVGVGFSPAAAVAASALIFAGGAQFAALGLVATPLAAIGVVAIVNSRYFLLSTAALDMARKARAGPLARVALALGVVDESYALQAAWPAAPLVGLLCMPLFLWTLWIGGTLAGALLGARLPPLAPFGLDYALPGIFVGLLGIFADSREKLLAGLAAVAVAGGLALAGLGTVAVLVVPPLFAFGLGRWMPRAG